MGYLSVVDEESGSGSLARDCPGVAAKLLDHGFGCGRMSRSHILGEYDTGQPGPLLIVVGGLHGNEPSGIEAVKRVLARLEQSGLRLAGRLVALVGNLSALDQRVRFVDCDLNRMWPEESLRSPKIASQGVEPRELDELRDTLARVTRGPSRTILLDLHSTSADGPPFCILADTLQNREIAFSLPFPIVLGLEETVSGTLMEYFTEQGHAALCVEGGQHDLASTVDHHESAIWIVLTHAGLLRPEETPDLAHHRRRLADATRGVPRVVEVTHRHDIPQGEDFVMDAGFSNFDTVRVDQLLARSGPSLEHEVRAPSAGMLLMPLYQPQGSDGFFMLRRVRPFWLRVSALLRRLRLDALLPLLPGVSKDPDRRGILVVDRRVARFFATDLFHLFGYRKTRQEADRLVLSRRRDGTR